MSSSAPRGTGIAPTPRGADDPHRVSVDGAIVLVVLVGALAAGAACELILRRKGFHTPLLYERTAYGYRVKPGQTIRRFGNRVSYDDFGLRSEPVAGDPAPGTLRILCVGDSVTFGGTTVDQRETYPYRLRDALGASGATAEVLNASAGGWALHNEEGWLREHGILGSRIVLLQVGTDDLWQRPAPSELVGRHPQFPDRAPPLAIVELVRRYLLPKLRRRLGIKGPLAPGEEGGPDPRAIDAALRSLGRMIDLVRSSEATPVVLFMEERPGSEHSDPLVASAKASLATLLSRLGVSMIRPGPFLADNGGARLFQDVAHLTPEGHALLATYIARSLPLRSPGALEPTPDGPNGHSTASGSQGIEP
jgi:hypothetical protein